MRALLGAVAIAAAACTPKAEAKLEDGVVVPALYACRKADECRLELKTQPPIEVPVPACDRAELAEDAAGKAVAYRCAGKPWNVVRLRGGDRYLVDCNAPLGSEAKPDWSKLGAIEPRAMPLLDCANGAARAWAEIAKSIVEETGDRGAELAAKFVIATTLRPHGKDADGWLLAFDGLPPASQELVRKETCPALQRPTSPSLLYQRAARRCPIDAPNVPEIALQAYKNHLAASRRDFGGLPERSGATLPPADLTDVEQAFTMEGFIALKQKPQEAARASCDLINQLSREYDPVRVAVAASILALTKTRCAALDKKTDLWPCDLALPQRSKIEERVARFPDLASANDALFDAITIDGKYPPDWRCP
jgi:hypothetical protein